MASDQVSDFHLSSLLHPNHVVALQSYFSRTSDDPACQKLSLQQFTKALKKVLGPSSSTIPDDQLARMFNRIDANSDGSVTWDEWCDFFLLFDQRHINLYRDMHSSILQPRDGYSGKDPSIGTRHGVIEHILALLVPMELLKPPEWLYVTCARNGTVSLWDPTSLAVVGSLRPPNPTQWVTNMIALSVPNFVAVSVVDRFIYIIQLSSLSVVETLGPLAHAAVGMAAFRNADGGHMLAFGDMGGGLNLRTVRVVSSEKVAFVSPVRHVIHRDWVTQVTYLAAYRYLITASMDSSIKFSNLADGAVQRQFNCHRSGVYSFCYSPQLNLMASSGSRSVLLWNPDQMDVLASLQGHASPVHQMVLDERAYKLFTLSMDKVLKVWDCYTYQCMQTIVDPTVHYPDDRIGRIFWDAKLLHLVSSTTRLRVWPIHTVLQSNTRTSHDCAISCATYTPALHQVATGDVRSAIHTWDASTGELVMRIPRAHGSNQITVVTYEFTGKRVLSGAADGSVHIWNASNGQLLSKLHRAVPVAGPMEVSGIVYVVPQVTAKSLNQDRYILVSGWDRQVVKYKDTKALDVYPLEVFTESTHTHSEDVVAMCYITPPAALVVSASVDGSIFLWSFTIRLLRHRLTLPSAQASYDMTFRVKAAGTAPDEPSDFVDCLIPYPSQASFISGSNRGRIDMWCAESGSIKQSILATTTMGHGITSLALDDANAQLAAGNAAGDVHLWDITNVAWYYSTPLPTQQKNATAALVRKWQHASLVSTWKAHSDGVVFIAHVSNLIVSAGRDGVLAVWSHRGHQMGIFGHDRVTLPREPCTTAPMDRPQLDDLKASAPPPLQRTLANKALRTLSPRVAGRLLPSDLIKPASARAMAAPQPASPRELRLKQTNHLTVHAVTDVPRKVHDFLHASLVDATEDEFRRKDAACNL